MESLRFISQNKKTKNPNDRNIDENDTWSIVSSYFDFYGQVQHQIESYNDFIENGIRQVFENNKLLKVSWKNSVYKIEFGECILNTPTHGELNGCVRKITPTECTNRDITYQAELLVDIETTDTNGHVNRYPKELIGHIPVMVRSNLCNLKGILNDKEELAKLKEDLHDPGGYFIIKGGAKVIASQERTASNRAYVFKDRKRAPKFTLYTQVRSGALTGSHSTTTEVGIMKDNLISVTLPYIELTSIPLGVMYRALGVKGDIKSVVNYILEDFEDRKALDILIRSLEYSLEIKTQEQALLFIGKKGVKFTRPQKYRLEEDSVDNRESKEKKDRKRKLKLAYEEAVSKKEKNLSYEALLRKSVILGFSSKPYEIAKELAKTDEKTKSTLTKILKELFSKTKELTENDINIVLKELIDVDEETKQAISYARHLLTVELFPHLESTNSNFVKKRFYLGYMTKKLLWVILKRSPLQDRDHFANKRVATAGILLCQQFEGSFRRMKNEIENAIERTMRGGSSSIKGTSYINPKTITNAMNGALSDNSWGVRGKNQGVTQKLDQFNYISTLSNLRKIVTPISQEGGKIDAPRKLHSSQWGITCVTGDTKILQADGTTKEIRNMNEECEVVTVNASNPNTLENEPSKISNMISFEKEIFCITTDSGKRINCTDDHPFLTDKGWVKAKDLFPGSKVVTTWQPSEVPDYENTEFIIEPDTILDFSYRKELEELGLVGKNLTHFQRMILARLSGLFCTSSQLQNNEISFSVEEEIDTLSVNRDICFLGFSPGKVKNNPILSNDWTISKKGSLIALLEALVYPSKSNELFSIPGFIFASSLKVQREWLSVIQREYLVHSPRGVVLTNNYYHNSEYPDIFLQQIQSIYSKFGIETKIFRTLESFFLKVILNSDSLFNYAKHISSIYSNRKERNSSICREYLLFHERTISQKKALKPSIRKFMKERYIKLSEKVYSVIESIEPAGRDVVYDFTTLSENHSFIANCFVVHNCLAETPEGKKCGLIKNLALGCYTTIGCNPRPLLEFLETMDIIKFEEFDSSSDNLLKLTKVFVNGSPLGVTKYPSDFVRETRAMRRGSLNPEVSISHSKLDNEIRISTEPGRLCRPLLVVENGKILLKKRHVEEIQKGEWNYPSVWQNLLDKGFIEFIDKDEEEDLLVSLSTSEFNEISNTKIYKYTHCEVHPSLIFGVGASLIPYPDHNQCIFEREPVLMADGSSKEIRDVCVGDEVITFDPETSKQSFTKVVQTYTGITNKKVYEIETVSGRKIKATYDHRFMTFKGWTRLEDLNVSSMKMSAALPHSYERPFGSFISAVQRFTSPQSGDSSLVRSSPQIGDSTLIGVSLEPQPIFKEKTERKLIISREDVIQRLNSLSMDTSHLKDLEIYSLYSDYPGIGVMARLFGWYLAKPYIVHSEEVDKDSYDCFGLPFRLAIPYLEIFISEEIPEWIKQGSKHVKREFLAGLKGGANGKCYRSKRSIREENSLKNLSDTFVFQTIELFQEFGISCELRKLKNGNYIETVSPYSFPQSGNSYTISTFGENTVKSFETIGYRYNKEKTLKLGIIVEYLKVRKTFPINFLDWKKMVKISETTLFIPILSIKEVEDNKIADITTESNNQSFLSGYGRFCVHNSPRNTYQSAMGKQAIGVPGTNYLHKTRGVFFAMDYPQKPLITSKTAKLIGFDNLPAGQNTVVAVCPWQGFGQEDSIIMNQDSIDRGFMSITAFICYEAKIDRPGEKFEIPIESEVNRFKGSVKKLSLENIENFGGNIYGSQRETERHEHTFCYVRKGVKVEEGNTIIGKVICEDDSTASLNRKNKTDESVVYDQPWPGIIHAVHRGINGAGYPYIRIVVAQKRPPVFGDKFCFSQDHEILTDNGWIGVDRIEKSHKIASLKNNELVYENPTNIVSFDSPREMVEIDSSEVSFCVTPNHNMYVRESNKVSYSLQRADSLFGKNVYFKKTANLNRKGLPTFLIPIINRNFRIDSWLVFFGLWFVEGRIFYNEITLLVNQNYKEYLRYHLKALGMSFEFGTDTLIVIIYDKDLADYLSCIDKSRLPTWVWSLNLVQCRELLTGLTLNKIGHMNLHKEEMIATLSQSYMKNKIYTLFTDLKDDIMRLILHCGYASKAQIIFTKPPGYRNFLDIWEITFKKINKTLVTKESIKLCKPNSPKVYCCTVPSGLLYVRRVFENNKIPQRPSWVGNSARHGQQAIVKGKILASRRMGRRHFQTAGTALELSIRTLLLKRVKGLRENLRVTS